MKYQEKNTKLQTLLVKFPETFLTKDRMTTEQLEGGYPWFEGFRCNDGWFVIIAKCVGFVSSHNKSQLAVAKREWEAQKKGWEKLMEQIASDNLERHQTLFRSSSYFFVKTSSVEKEPIEPFREFVPPIPTQINCVKEKFGSLRIYTVGGDSFAEGLVAMTEALSSSVCEDCGTMHDVGMVRGSFIRNICQPCFVKWHEDGRIDRVERWLTREEVEAEREAVRNTPGTFEHTVAQMDIKQAE